MDYLGLAFLTVAMGGLQIMRHKKNPFAYIRWDPKRIFTATIDGQVLDIHNLTYQTLKDSSLEKRTLDPQDPWTAILDHIERSHDQVTPLYVLEKSGDLAKDPGKQLIDPIRDHCTPRTSHRYPTR